MNFGDLLVNAFTVGNDFKKEIAKIFPNMTFDQEQKIESALRCFTDDMNRITKQLITDEFAKLKEKLK